MLTVRKWQMNANSRLDQGLKSRACGVVVAATTLALAGTPTLAQSWTQLSPGGVPPALHWQDTAVYDPDTNQMIVFGGLTPSGRANDVWRLSDGSGSVGASDHLALLVNWGPCP